ncbi:MAG: type II toxin-antitoxin system VapC family toxin [bacterium]|nr:type II toxin-antitoxin system VapC family toxin [bacterium]
MCSTCGALSAERAAEALDDFAAFSIRRYPHDMLLGRIWQLRHNATAYDAAYLALAESLEATLITCDARLKRTRGVEARVELP